MAIKVVGSGTPGAVDVATRVINGVHYPLYLGGVGDLTVDAWGINKVSLPVSLFSSKFTFDIDPAKWFMYEDGTQVYAESNITSSNSEGVITGDATANIALLESRIAPRYQANRGHLYSTALWCPNSTNDGIRSWGVGCVGENTACFVLKSDGLLYATIESGGSTTYQQVIDTSGVSAADGTGFDVEKGNIYDIQFQWRGVGDYFWYINNTLVHQTTALGTRTALSMENPALPAFFRSEYTTEAVAIHAGCVDITSENGDVYDKEAYVSAYAEGVSVTTDTPVIVIHNPAQINSQTNTRTMELARMSFNCSKKAVFKVWTTRDPGDITGETLKVIGNGSYAQTDSTNMDPTAVRATSVTVANLSFVTSVPVEAQSAREVINPDQNRIQFPIVRGDYLVVTCTAATAVADVVVEFGEQR